jgi:hypothetical protein
MAYQFPKTPTCLPQMTRYHRPSGLTMALEYSATWSGVGMLGPPKSAEGGLGIGVGGTDVATSVGVEEEELGGVLGVNEVAAASVVITGMGVGVPVLGIKGLRRTSS